MWLAFMKGCQQLTETPRTLYNFILMTVMDTHYKSNNLRRGILKEMPLPPNKVKLTEYKLIFSERRCHCRHFQYRFSKL